MLASKLSAAYKFIMQAKQKCLQLCSKSLNRRHRVSMAQTLLINVGTLKHQGATIHIQNSVRQRQRDGQTNGQTAALCIVYPVRR